VAIFHAGQNPADFGFGDLFDLVGEAVVVADSVTGTIQLWNAAASRMFGYDRAEAVGMPVSVLVPDDLRERHSNGLARFAREGTIELMAQGETVEVPAVCRDGRRVWVELSLTPLPRDSEHPMALALIRDVTDRHNAQEALARANRALRDFVAVAAHDLRAPVATLVSVIELVRDLLDDVPIPDEASTFLETADEQGRSLLSFIGDLLDTASIETGTVTVRPETIELADALAAAAAGHEDLTVEVPVGLACVADPRHLQRIVTNLVTNAYRHGAPPVTIRATADGAEGFAEIAVCDRGPGIVGDARLRLFDAYAAGVDSPGTGLGLSIARGLAQANAGDLDYDLRPTGSCFVLRLPLP
jgi:PAS domain S-box-containing protein